LVLNRILFVEDDLLFRESTAELLESEGFAVSEAASFEEALEIGFREVFDIYLLDINLGRKNGIELLKELRSFGDTKPVLMLTSHKSPKIATECFESGCDDFVRKPCEPIELIARIKSKLRDSFGQKGNIVELGESFRFDLDKKKLSNENGDVDLSQKELELLSILVRNKNSTVTLETIERELWPASKEPSYGSIRVYINSLKKLLGRDSIINIKGIGYRLEN
jgi:DNA-binding response OmpR family regulator